MQLLFSPYFQSTQKKEMGLNANPVSKKSTKGLLYLCVNCLSFVKIICCVCVNRTSPDDKKKICIYIELHSYMYLNLFPVLKNVKNNCLCFVTGAQQDPKILFFKIKKRKRKKMKKRKKKKKKEREKRKKDCSVVELSKKTSLYIFNILFKLGRGSTDNDNEKQQRFLNLVLGFALPDYLSQSNKQYLFPGYRCDDHSGTN
ncbi:hypothetical protein RFI_05738 [Reticulomyxa filosa]|uniref:Uncharacterized protein n=1 Tax=Reticulomyxa filosa TaxID=46433 RepID=X6P1G4_RETFI|nr:hypothetical protein RFI_05738 [Reticulomyxa filosa]|eukprot:ETO31382.1 hypothetical protein RFI_05738 [Reticulomyxa filosa]